MLMHKGGSFFMTTREHLAEFSVLVETNLNMVIRYISFLVEGNEDAKDIAQEVFLKAWKQFNPLMKNTFRAWIIKIARNTVIDRFKKRKLPVSYSGAYIEQAVSDSSENKVVSDSENDFCFEGLPAFSRLPIQHREVVYMRHIEQLSYEEMSRITGKSQGALRKIVSRAILTIRKEVTNATLQQS